MKPLELNVYPPLTALEQESVRLAESTGLAMFHTPPAGFFERKAKRLTEPELAAEYESARGDYLLQVQAGHYWAPLENTWSSEPDEVLNRAKTLLRFATLPHYDEEVTP